MIKVICKDNKIIYNAYHLVKAFWPDREIGSEVVEDIDSRILVVESAASCESVNECNQMELSGQYWQEILRAEDIKKLYIRMGEITGQELPWGMLTGVRPTKLASKWIEEHIHEYVPDAESCKDKQSLPVNTNVAAAQADFVKWFYEDRCVSELKAKTAFNVAMKERELMPDNLKGGYSLYIGIPFCPTVCSYCSFSSGAIGEYADRVDAYIDALCRDMEQVASSEHCGQCIIPTTVYMGGGTPTSLSAEQLDRVLTRADELFRISEGLETGVIKEFTVEAGRPDSITREKLEVIKKHGVTRISINPQSMQQKTLDAIGRNHTVEQIRETFALARELGFDNINMDIIVGLPGEDNEDVRDTLEQIKAMSPDSLTVHSLAVKRSSAIGIARKVKSRKSMMDDNTGAVEMAAPDIALMINDARLAADEMGMAPYYLYRQKSIAGNFENVGYARPGKEGLYNILIMEEVQSIMACGAGASTKIVTEEAVPNPKRKGQLTHLIRSENVKNIDDYIRKYTSED